MFQRLILNVFSAFLPLLVDHHPGQHGLQGHPPVLQSLHHTVGGPKGVLRDDQGHDGPQGGGKQGVAKAEDDDAVETVQKVAEEAFRISRELMGGDCFSTKAFAEKVGPSLPSDESKVPQHRAIWRKKKTKPTTL